MDNNSTNHQNKADKSKIYGTFHVKWIVCSENCEDNQENVSTEPDKPNDTIYKINWIKPRFTSSLLSIHGSQHDNSCGKEHIICS